MKVDGRNYRTIWLDEDNRVVHIIDQRDLPHKFTVEELPTFESVCTAIREMHIRGAPAIGAAALFGMYLAAAEAPEDRFESYLEDCSVKLLAARPTAVDLAWAVQKQKKAIASAGKNPRQKTEAARCNALLLIEESVERCRMIGEYGAAFIEQLAARNPARPLNIMTHCNAGWLACVDYGTATAPIYAAFERGVPLHVWVSETRPRCQGARLTAWELLQHGVPHTLLVDNAAGHLMQRGMVDLCITGADRVTRTGDAANQIGTYMKALTAKEHEVPFYMAFPSSTIDWSMRNGVTEIPIEQRNWDWTNTVQGLHQGELIKVLTAPAETPVIDFAFDVTPRHLICGFITERGVCAASEEALARLFPEKRD